jgi:hypothetical protein
MAIKKALVLGADGGIQQLQAGDDLEVGVGNQGFSATNGTAGAVTEGMAVYVSAVDEVQLAQADIVATSRVIGLVKSASIASTSTGTILTDGILDVADWTDVTGTEFLTAGLSYYLSATTPGQLTTTRPVGGGESVVYVGRAISTTTLEISIERPILL